MKAQRALFDKVLKGSDGRVVFDLDVTAERRPGYFGLPEIGPVFVENRYTDWGKYWPHRPLRAAFSVVCPQGRRGLSPRRLSMTFFKS